MDQGGACVTKQSHIGYVSHCYDKISGKNKWCKKRVIVAHSLGEHSPSWLEGVWDGWSHCSLSRKKRDEFWCSQLAYFLSTYIQSQCHAHSGPVFHPQFNWKAPYSYTQRCVSQVILSLLRRQGGVATSTSLIPLLLCLPVLLLGSPINPKAALDFSVAAGRAV